MKLNTEKIFNMTVSGSPDAVKLAGEASTRVYYRINSDEPVIACIDKSIIGLNENTFHYLTLNKIFKSGGIPVPEMISADFINGLVILEDLGSLHLEDLSAEGYTASIREIYFKAVDIMIKIQSIPGDSLPVKKYFDTDKLMFEYDFFIEHALENFFEIKNRSAIEELRKEFEITARLLQKEQAFVVNHRDYHSRNIMIRGGEPYIIDYQDSMLGLPQYDLASLLRDCYVELPSGFADELKNYYYERSSSAGVQNFCRDEFERLYQISGFQRNVKAAGTFARQALLGRTKFISYIQPAFRHLEMNSGIIEELDRAESILFELTEGQPLISGSEHSGVLS